jgi:Tfp pilus assembly protein FimT
MTILRPSRCKQGVNLQRGFTLLEQLVILVMLGILGAIAAPSWSTFWTTLQLNMAQDRIYGVIQTAQTEARRNREVWQASFRQVDRQVQWAVHPVEPGIFVPSSLHWTALEQPDVILDIRETTLDCSGRDCASPDGLWRVQFNHRGHTHGQLGRITVKSIKGGKIKRCVFVSTLIGNLRTAREQPKPDDSKRYCY